MRQQRGEFFVVSAPSGAGKTSLCQALIAKTPGISFSVSYTTRHPRPGEVDGKDYSFVDDAAFEKMVKAGEFAEWAKVHGSYYGTSRRRLMETMEQGMSVMLDIDVQGARQLKKSMDGGCYIFILPPSKEALLDRLVKRGGDAPDVIKARLRKAADEIREYLWYDYVIINDVFERALAELEAVVLSSGLCPDTIDPQWVAGNFLTEEDV